MKNYSAVGFLFLFLSTISISAQEHPLKKTVILEGYISISLPEELTPMSEEDKSARFRQEKMPIFALCNEYSDVFIAMNKPTESANEDAIPKYLDYYTGVFGTFYASAEVLKSEIKTVNGKQVGCIEFTAMDIFGEAYHCFFFTNLEGKLLTFDFVCPKEEMADWMPIALKIVESLEVK